MLYRISAIVNRNWIDYNIILLNIHIKYTDDKNIITLSFLFKWWLENNIMTRQCSMLPQDTD